MAMSLYEEYVKRKGLDIPVIVQCDSAQLILSNGESFRILSIDFKFKPGSKGEFVIDIKEPLYSPDQIFEDAYFNILDHVVESCYCDEYEIVLSQIVSDLKAEGFLPIDQSQIFLVNWGLFYSVVGKNVNINLIIPKLVNIANCPENDYTERKFAIDLIVSYFSKKETSALAKFWKKYFIKTVTNYPEWLAKFFNQYRDTEK